MQGGVLPHYNSLPVILQRRNQIRIPRCSTRRWVKILPYASSGPHRGLIITSAKEEIFNVRGVIPSLDAGSIVSRGSA